MKICVVITDYISDIRPVIISDVSSVYTTGIKKHHEKYQRVSINTSPDVISVNTSGASHDVRYTRTSGIRQFYWRLIQ